MSLASPAGLLLALLAIPILALHMLRPRRPPMEVSSTMLWQDISRPATAARPWQKLRPSTLLILQLLVVALLAIAAARPVRVSSTPLARHTVFIVDASGSMAATDGSPDRIGAAKSAARRLRAKLPAGGVASLVVASSQPRVLLSASPDAGAFSDAVGRVQASPASADFAAAFTLAESMETPGTPAGFVFLSDGGLTNAEKALLPPGSRYERVGSRATNRAVSRLGVEQRGTGLHARVTVRNTGGPAASQKLHFDVDGVRVTTIEIDLPAGATVDRELDLPAGERVQALLEGDDLLGADNHAAATVSSARPVRVLLAGPDDVYLQHLLAAMPGVTVDRSPTARPAGPADLAIYNQVGVPTDPGAPFLAIAPPGGAAGVTVQGSADRPAVTLVQPDDPVVRGLDLSDVAIAEAQRLNAPTARVLVAAEATPLLLRGTQANHPFLYLAFPLDRSNLPVQVAFPLLGQRIVAELSGPLTPSSDLRVGQSLPLGGGAATVESPTGVRTPVEAGSPAPVADHTGFWIVHRAGRPDQVLAVNASPAESTLTPVRSIPVQPRPSPSGERRPRDETSLVAWLIVALLVLLVVELVLSNRQRGVSRRQWRAGLVLRAVGIGLLLAVLAGLTVPRSGRRVAVLFLVDGSDSMGEAGRADALAWTKSALAHQPRSAVAGVAFFGGDARLDTTVQHHVSLGSSTVKVDTSRTDLANALRLAGAVLPSDARRRIVVVSDGRATQGDAAAEAARLEEEGIHVDIHVVARPPGADAALARVDTPGRVRKGEAIVLHATVVASQAQTVRLVVHRDAATVADKTVEVPAGTSVVDLPVGVADSGPVRYRIDLQAAADTVPENNIGFAAVDIEGPARVLLVEGTQGVAATLAGALRAGGLQVDVLDARSLPSLERLSSYSSTVLVDVDVHLLSNDQLTGLGAATRDLGRGLVAIGGDHSYSLGGYLNSELEALLPVKSQVDDPKRKASVAEVLAIDTSGSMGACHCRPGSAGPNGLPSGGNMLEGGADKTAISRSAAARAIAALGPNDQVGVMAFNSSQKFVVPLQQTPSPDVVASGLQGLTPAGGTDLPSALERAAATLRAAKAQLKHIILFSDGFTSTTALSGLQQQAAKLRNEGITVSVLATGEGAAESLRGVAEAGGGRFYPGRDLEEIPQIMSEEAVIATRSFVNEGQFFPKVVSAAAPVRDLRTSPALLGYLATTAKPTASTLLRVGDQDDPLLASWQVGLGRASAWTSDASARWSKNWSTWPGYVAFWTGVVKDTFSQAGTGPGGASARAQIDGDRLKVTVEASGAFPDGATASARLVAPDLTAIDVPLDRTSATAFSGDVPVGRAGTYAVGAEVRSAGGAVLTQVRALASQSYAPEYQQGPPNSDGLLRISKLSGGRGAVDPATTFEAAGLPAGHGNRSVAVLLVLLAALLWPLDVALRRIALGGTGVVAMRNAVARVRRLEWRSFRPRLPARESNGNGKHLDKDGEDVDDVELEPVYGPQEPVAKELGTVSELLEKRQRRQTRRR